MKREPQSAPENPHDINDQIVRYLLGEVDDVERNGFDERFMNTPGFADTVASVEDDLIMQYVRGDLDPHLVSRFSEVYLNSPARLARIEQARTLRHAVQEISAERKPHAARMLRIPLAITAAAAVILLAAIFWPRWHRSHSGEPAKIAYASFSLEPGITRSAEGTQITLPQAIDEVHLELALPPAVRLQTYSAVLGTAERPAAWKGLVAPSNGRLIVIVPARILNAGDYTLELQRNGEEVLTFYFRMAK